MKNKRNSEASEEFSIEKKNGNVMMDRRDFLKLSGILGVGAVLTVYGFDIKKIFALAATGDIRVVWLQGASDSGCTISLLQGVNPDFIDTVTQFRLATVFHPDLMIASGEQATAPLEEIVLGAQSLDVLIVEGALPEGNFCTVGEINGQPVPVRTWVQQLGAKAKYVVAVGTCATFGGIPSGSPNPTRCISVAQALPGKSVINIPGCPAHPDWVLLTLATVLGGVMPTLDANRRPTVFFHERVHEDCPREEDYEHNNFAPNPSGSGCLLHLGCRGPITRADCRRRKWNNKTNYCIDSGAPCIGCTEPGFPDQPFSPFYQAQQKSGGD